MSLKEKKIHKFNVDGIKLKKVRIFYNDLDAIDSDSDEDDYDIFLQDYGNNVRVKKLVTEISVNPIKKSNQKGKMVMSDDDNKKDPIEKPPIKYKGVRRRKWGKYVAEIRDPLKKKRTWIDTYNTAEEAAQAYNNKKFEFDRIFASQKRDSSSPNITSLGEVNGVNITSPSSVLDVSNKPKIQTNKQEEKPTDQEIKSEKICVDFEHKSIFGLQEQGEMSVDLNDFVCDYDDAFPEIPFGIIEVGNGWLGNLSSFELDEILRDDFFKNN